MMYVKFNEVVNQVKEGQKVINSLKVAKVKDFLKVLDLEDMFNEMTRDQILRYYEENLNFDENKFCGLYEFETIKNIRLANLLAEVNEDELTDTITECKDSFTIEDILWGCRVHLVENIKSEELVSLEQLKEKLNKFDFIGLKTDLEKLFLQALDIEDLDELVKQLDKNITLLDKIYSYRLQNGILRLNDWLDVIKWNAPALTYYICTKSYIEDNKRIVQLADNEADAKEYLAYDLVEPEDLNGFTPYELGANLIKTKRGDVYFQERITLQDEEETQTTAEWVLI